MNLKSIFDKFDKYKVGKNEKVFCMQCGANVIVKNGKSSKAPESSDKTYEYSKAFLSSNYSFQF